MSLTPHVEQEGKERIMKNIRQAGFTCIELAIAGTILGTMLLALLPAVQ